MLETIVHNNHISLWELLRNTMYCKGSISTYYNRSLWKFTLYLQWLVTYEAITIIDIYYSILLAFTAITARQDNHITLLRIVFNKHLYGRSFACASNGDISHTNNRNIELLAMKYIDIKKQMSQLDCGTVKNRCYFK